MLPSQFYAARPSDRLAMLALQQIEDTTHSCGRPVDEAFDTRMDGGYEYEVVTCQACAYVAKMTEGEHPEVDLKPGQFLVPIAVYDPDTDKDIPVGERF